MVKSDDDYPMDDDDKEFLWRLLDQEGLDRIFSAILEWSEKDTETESTPIWIEWGFGRKKTGVGQIAERQRVQS